MKKIIMVIFLSFPLAIFSSTLVILECELLEGGTIEDVKRINSAWVKSVNELNDKKVRSQVLEAVLADNIEGFMYIDTCLLYTSPSPRDAHESRMPSSA